MTVDELERLDRERRDADARYNGALTALDHVIVSIDRRELTRDDAAQIGTALLEFLQQITAFVESKDRQVAAEARAGLAAIAQSVEPVAELSTQVHVLQRAFESVRKLQPALEHQRSPADNSRSAAMSAAPPSLGDHDDYKYVGFEDQFRGSDAAIEERLRAYVPLFERCTDVLDIGCGRGELLAAFKAAGVPARGIDANDAMVAASRERGLDAIVADARAYLDSLPDRSLGGIVAIQVVEHLEPSYLTRLLDGAARTLRPGAPIVLETINPACWLAFFSSYLRDFTHVRPVHPETLQFLLRAGGFERVTIRYSAPVPDHMKMKAIDLPAAVLGSPEPIAAALVQVAHAANANAAILNNLMFTHLDYAVVGYRI